MRETTRKLDASFVGREQRPRWHEETVRGRTVFWSDGEAAPAGVVLPVVMRPLLFSSKELDASGKEREYLVVGLTSTTPARLVERWLDFPRTSEHLYLPNQRKTNGQLWVNWSQVYRWTYPYLNLSSGVISTDALLPPPDAAKTHLTDGWPDGVGELTRGCASRNAARFPSAL